MTTREKIAKLRKENNMTQEQLAEYLDVSRQSVSKWESNVTFPETDKLLKMSELYECSIDYLLKEEIEEKNVTQIKTKQSFYKTFEYTSTKRIKGVPLVHICFDVKKRAKGIIAIGYRACGLISIGLLSIGVMSLGLLSIGLLAFGCFALGGLAFGAISAGLFAFGAIAVGLLFSAGAISVGSFAVGSLSFGNYFACGDRATAKVAVGSTVANGSYFGYCSDTPNSFIGVDKLEVSNALSSVVPPWLKWLIDFVLLFI